jgi:hypothetical protein
MLGRLGARAWGISSEHSATVACVALIVIVAALVVPPERLATLAVLVPLIVALPWVILLLVSDTRRLAEGKYPIGVVLLMLVLPFTQFALSGSRADVMVQGAALALAVFYFLTLEPTKRASAFRRVLPVVILWVLLFGLFLLSYIAANAPATVIVSSVAPLLGAVAFILLAAVYADSVTRVASGLLLLAGVAMLQLPVVLMQATGVASKLGGRFASLGTLALEEGAISSLSVATRLNGSFRSTELLAEFAAMAFLLCFGLIVFDLLPSWRRALYVAMPVVAIVGWFTGTRGFVLMVGSGVLLLASLSVLIGTRLSRLTRALAVVGLVALAVFIVVPSDVTSGYLGRFLENLSGPNILNRGLVWSAARDIMPGMPFWGFGQNMLPLLADAYQHPIAGPHSLYLAVLLTAGPLALVALFALLAMLIGMCVRTLQRANLPTARALAGVLLAVLIIWAANEVKIEFLRLGKMGVYYIDLLAFFFGLIACLHGLAREDQTRRSR